MPSDRQAYSVSQLTRAIRELLEHEVGTVRVEGEVSNLRRQSSGHQYFSLKDDRAQLRCVLFRGYSKHCAVRLEDGLQVQAFGEISVYEVQGQYQLIVRSVQLKGLGELQARFEALKRKLQAEGLFEQDRKRAIPRFPNSVVLITSPSGAAVRDMLNVIGRRAPWLHVMIYPVRVQGEGAASEIAAALERVSAASEAGDLRVDTVIVGRGGGSIEDLWAFNEEIVARAVEKCAVPVISAVGHEIDFTISDFVADLRAPTPSAAAELVAPDRAELVEQLFRYQERMRNATEGQVRHWRTVLDLTARSGAFREAGRVLLEHRQSLDYTADRLRESFLKEIRERKQEMQSHGRALQLRHPGRILMDRATEVERARAGLKAALQRGVDRKRERLKSLKKLTQSLGPESIFARGFSITLNEEGEILTSARDLKPGEKVTTRLQKGSFESEVRKVQAPK